MKRILVITAVIFIAVNIFSLDIPDLPYYVNDYAGFISQSVQAELEQKLKTFEETDSTQIVILTIPSLEGESLEDFSIKIAQSKGIGQKGKDNGALLLVTREERKIRLEVGYGLEGKLTDLLAGRVIDNIISPNFKKGDMDAGFTEGIDAIIGIVKGEFTADNIKKRSKSDKEKSFPFALIIILFVIISNMIHKQKKPVKGLIGGGFGSAALLLLLLFSGFPFSLLLLIPVLIFGGGLGAFLMIIFSLFAGASGSGRSSGGFFGGSSGGGFSGGGGSFGGGGSSGGW